VEEKKKKKEKRRRVLCGEGRGGEVGFRTRGSCSLGSVSFWIAVGRREAQALDCALCTVCCVLSVECMYPKCNMGWALACDVIHCISSPVQSSPVRAVTQSKSRERKERDIFQRATFDGKLYHFSVQCTYCTRRT
jgi:hypothetical protein